MSPDLIPKTQETLVRIYMGQNVRKEGILQSEVPDSEDAEMLFRKAFITKKHWYLDQYVTTAAGNALASGIVNERIGTNKNQFLERIRMVPCRILNFFLRRYVSKDLAFSADKRYFETNVSVYGSWADAILIDNRVWMIWNDFFESLISSELCVKTHDYVSTRGGEKRHFKYVISPEVQNFLVSLFDERDFSLDEEKNSESISFSDNCKEGCWRQ